MLGNPTLTDEFNEDGDGEPSEVEAVVGARQDLVDVLSGHATLMSPPEVTEGGFAPWSLRYSGHQFGSWAGQLGDGRAISIRACISLSLDFLAFNSKSFHSQLLPRTRLIPTLLMNFSSRGLVVRPFRGAQTGSLYSVLPFASIFVQKVEILPVNF